MAENKNSFLLYTDLKHTLSKLPDDKAGQLFKHILSYVNDENPQTDDIIIQIAFEPIRQQFKRDLRKYESICERNAINGSKGGRPKKQDEAKKPTGFSGLQDKPKKADSDTDSDNDIKKKVYIYNRFYDSELNSIETEKEKESYEKFIKILFGANSEKVVLSNVLKLEYQLSFDGFKKLLLKKPEKMTFTYVLEKLEFGANKDGKSYLKGRKSLKGIFDTFFRNNF